MNMLVPGDDMEKKSKYEVIELRPGDMTEEDLRAHAVNLADTNFVLDESIKLPRVRAKVREGVQWFRHRAQKVLPFELIGEETLNKLYPDYTKPEHVRAYAEISFPRLMKGGNIVGIKLEDRIAAVQGYKEMGTMPDGRKIFEITKSSTLPEYQGRGLNHELLKNLTEHMGDVVWVTASGNEEYRRSLARTGWKEVEMDDVNVAVQAMYHQNPDVNERLKGYGYKAMYFDPKEVGGLSD